MSHLPLEYLWHILDETEYLMDERHGSMRSSGML